MDKEKDKNIQEKPKYIDLVEFRRQEIQRAILNAQAEQNKEEYRSAQKQLPWYKRDLFINLFGAGVALLVMTLIILIAYFVGNI
ncbi:hypothetical protein [Mycoplasma seminis]|uniref:Uncharacterized protein n=1 Tax=Mycoplasma seminis TaxID=512749 RepID=A0ABY9HCI3_9MOLU|nr:hypothetical protein [Mycoplasma seminis]WLP85904.1 hypothetical protein Q8852_02040 [Mycoplasma seminis]